MNADDQGMQLANIIIEEDAELSEVWLRYFSFGGSASEDEFVLYVLGEGSLSEMERDLAALALQEVVSEHRDAQGR